MRLVLVEMLGHLASQSYLSEEYEYARDKLGGSICGVMVIWSTLSS